MPSSSQPHHLTKGQNTIGGTVCYQVTSLHRGWSNPFFVVPLLWRKDLVLARGFLTLLGRLGCMEPEEGLRLLVEEYDRMAAAYDANAAPYHRPAARELVEMAAVSDGESVLDVGCGTGSVALESTERAGPEGLVVGVDIAPGMVRLSRRKARREGLPHLQFHLMDARQLAFQDGAFGVVASCLGLPGFGHASAFREAYRVLRDGGRFVFCVGTGKATAVPFARLLEKYRPTDPSPEVERVLEARRSIAETKEPAVLRDPDRAREALRSSGFREVMVDTRVQRRVYPTPMAYVDYATAWGVNERELAAMRAETRERFFREFKERVAPLLTQQGLVTEVEHHFYLATR